MNGGAISHGPVHEHGMFNIELFDRVRWRGGMNRATKKDAIEVATRGAAEDGRRWRVFDPEERLVFDTAAAASGSVLAARQAATDDAVDELVAADKAYDAALAALEEHYRQVAERGYLVARLGEVRALSERFVAADTRRCVALGRVRNAS